MNDKSLDYSSVLKNKKNLLDQRIQLNDTSSQIMSEKVEKMKALDQHRKNVIKPFNEVSLMAEDIYKKLPASGARGRPINSKTFYKWANLALFLIKDNEVAKTNFMKLYDEFNGDAKYFEALWGIFEAVKDDSIKKLQY